jgi:hypothetical protein
MARHKIQNTKKAWRERAQRLAEDLARSEEAREQLIKGRDRLLEEVRVLSRSLSGLQAELGTEFPTIPVQVAASSGPVHLLRPPQTGRIPLQAPDGKRMDVPVRGAVSRPSAGRKASHRPTWATG